MTAAPSSSCLSENDVMALVRGTIDGARREAVTAHVDGCELCQELVAALVATSPPLGTSGARPHTARKGPLSAGDEVGRYRIREELGAGAMGVVYLADDRDLDRLAAVKMMQGQAEETSKRLLHEAQALARISHPNVITVYEVGTAHGQVFMAMEYVDGASLTAWLAREKAEVPRILEVFAQAGRGLAVAHEAGLVHRDFKPDNVLVGKDGRVRVVDFGLARADAVVVVRVDGERDDVSAGGPEALRTMTRTAGFVGTPAYMSPEQFDGTPADARSDQFGFCVALFEALHGVHPFPLDSLTALMRAVKTGTVSAARNPRVPPEITAALLRGLAVDPASRFPDMPALLSALAPPASEVPAAPPRRPALALIAIALTALAVGSWSLFAPGSPAPAPPSRPPAPAPAPAPEPAVSASAPASASASASVPAPAPASASAPPRPPPRPAARPAAPPAASAPKGPLMPTTP